MRGLCGTVLYYQHSFLSMQICAIWYPLFSTRTTRTPAFWGYPCRLMITHTIESCWIPNQNKVEWPWRYRSRSKVITCDTPSHVSDHLYQIWTESIQNCRRYRADTIFKVKAKWPWKYRSRSKVITCDTFSNANDDLCQIWKECKQIWRFFPKWKPKNLRKIENLDLRYKPTL